MGDECSQTQRHFSSCFLTPKKVHRDSRLQTPRELLAYLPRRSLPGGGGDRDDMMWTDKFENDDPTRVVVPFTLRHEGLAPSGTEGSEHPERREPSRSRSLRNVLSEVSRAPLVRSACRARSCCDTLGRPAFRAGNVENKCQAVPDVFRRNPLKTNDCRTKQVSRICDVRRTPFSNFQFPRLVQNRRPACPEQRRGERPKGAEGHCFTTAIDPTRLSSRIGCNSLKTKRRCLSYPTINPGGLEPSLTASWMPPKMKFPLRQGTASAVPKGQVISGVLTPEVHTAQQCLKL